MSATDQANRDQQAFDEKFSWKPDDVIIERGRWTLTYKTEDRQDALVMTVDQLVRHLLDNDPGANADMTPAIFRFLSTNPQVPHMPDKLRRELESAGYLPRGKKRP